MNRLFFIYMKDFHNESIENFHERIRNKFAGSSIYKVNGSNNFILKVPETVTFSGVMEELGLSEEKKETGIVIELTGSQINGWYSQALWDFVSK